MGCHKNIKFIVTYFYIKKQQIAQITNLGFHFEKEVQNKFKISTRKEIIKIKAGINAVPKRKTQ